MLTLGTGHKLKATGRATKKRAMLEVFLRDRNRNEMHTPENQRRTESVRSVEALTTNAVQEFLSGD